MAHKAQRAISLESYKENTWALKRQGWGNIYGRTRNAYGKIDTSYNNNNFVATKFVFFKTSDESGHSEREVYYPGELSYAELLPSMTQPERAERKSKLFTNKDANNNKQKYG